MELDAFILNGHNDMISIGREACPHVPEYEKVRELLCENISEYQHEAVSLKYVVEKDQTMPGT